MPDRSGLGSHRKPGRRKSSGCGLDLRSDLRRPGLQTALRLRAVPGSRKWPPVPHACRLWRASSATRHTGGVRACPQGSPRTVPGPGASTATGGRTLSVGTIAERRYQSGARAGRSGEVRNPARSVEASWKPQRPRSRPTFACRPHRSPAFTGRQRDRETQITVCAPLIRKRSQVRNLDRPFVLPPVVPGVSRF